MNYLQIFSLCYFLYLQMFSTDSLNHEVMKYVQLGMGPDGEADITNIIATFNNPGHATTKTFARTSALEMHVINRYNESSDNDTNHHLWTSKSWFSNKYLKFVNSHWLQFSPPPRAAHYFLAVLYAFIMLTGLFGNSLVIFMFARCKSLRSPANILIANLAVSDLFMMMKMPIFIYNSMYEGIALGVTGCQIYGFVGGLTGTVSIVTLAAIALDRYYVIVYPLNRNSKKFRSKVCIVVTWIYGGIFSGIPLLGLEYGTYVPEGYLTSCSFDYLTAESQARHFILVYFFAAWFVPFLLISFCYFNIIKVVIRAKNIGSEMKDPGGSGRHFKEEEQKRTEIRLALVVLAIIGLWFVAWTPYAVVALLGISGSSDRITPLGSMVPALFCKTASCFDPFVYAVTHKKFREEMQNIFANTKHNSKRSGKKVWSTNVTQQTSLKREASNEYDVEEVVVEFPTLDTERNSSRKVTGRVLITPTENSTRNLSATGAKVRSSWILKPNFSNRSSSVRNIARTWNRSKENSLEENIT